MDKMDDKDKMIVLQSERYYKNTYKVTLLQVHIM